MGYRWAGALLTVLSLGGHTLPLAAQRPIPRVSEPRPPDEPRPLLVLALTDLDFGTVLPGVTVSVRPGEGGLFEIQGSRGQSVRVDFLLPFALTTTFGATLPVSFGPADGFVSTTRNASTRLRFNPHAPVITSLTSQGVLFLFLGGSATPGNP